MSRLPRAVTSLTLAEARRSALWAQGFLGSAGRRGGVPAVLDRLGAVQLDTISVLARSHELVAQARLGAVARDRVEAAYWGAPPAAFEYWAHAASILPIDLWPWFAKRRRRYSERGRGDRTAKLEILRRLEHDGPLTARQLGGARLGGPWWDWSPLKRAAEELFAAGEVVCVTRRAWHRVYDLAERAIPEHLYRQAPGVDECTTALARRAGEALGVATLAHIADYFRQRQGTVRRVMDATGLIPVSVVGWSERAWASPAALDALERGLRGRHRTTLISPFDSLIWHRPRTEQLFGFVRRLEAYVPAARRVDGYYAMPVLHGGRLVARVDPAREGRTLVARTIRYEGRDVDAVVAALIEAAGWVGCDAVRCERVVPQALGEATRAALTVATG